jgi:Transposase DDE domain
MPFKLRAAVRHHIPRQKFRITNWREYEAGLRNRGSLTVWFSNEAIAAWKGLPSGKQGGQPRYSELAIETALTLRVVFRLALRQCEGLISSIMHMLGIDLAVPDHTTLSRRARTLKVDAKPHSGTNDLHLIVDSTGLKLRGAGDWLQDKHGTGGKRRSWLKLHIGMDAGSGEIVASDLTDKDVDDAAHVPVLLDQISTPIASFMGDGAYDTGAVYAAVISRNPDARVIVPPSKDAVLSANAATAPTQRDKYLMEINAHGRAKWQETSGYTRRSKVEVQISRYKRVIGDTLRSRGHPQRKTEAKIAVKALNRMNELGRPISVRVA